MLKDLQKRQGEETSSGASARAPITVVKGNHQHIIIIVLLTALVTLFAVYVFQLQNENTRFKASELDREVTADVVNEANNNNNAHINKSTNDPLDESKVSQHPDLSAPVKPSVNTVVALENSSAGNQIVESHIVESNASIGASPEKAMTDNGLSQSTLPQGALTQGDEAESKQPKTATTVEPKITKVAAANIAAKKTNNQHLAEKAAPKVEETDVTSSMTITRSQLSPQELATKKLSRAKEALVNNDLAQAEKLFEEVVLILPSEKEARVQLAALWFGKKDYQAATNILSQGIALDPHDESLRMLKARIYMQINNHGMAFQVLQDLPNVEHNQNIEYQSLLATQAQNAEQLPFAIMAYLRLTKLQANVGRWWLGLAIAYDRNSEFTLAKNAYKLAIAQQDLSGSANEFARQRLQELGD